MVCDLPAPRWHDLVFQGLRSSTENLATSSYDLSWAPASAGVQGALVFYNIYWGTDIFTLFDTPKAFSTHLTASLPKSITGNSPFFAVRASELGATLDFNSYNLSGEMDGLLQQNSSRTTRNLASKNWIRTPINDAIIIEDATISPSGLNDAFGLVPDITNTEHSIAQGVFMPAPVTTMSIFAKKGTQDYIFIHTTSKPGYITWFNVATGVVGTRGVNILSAGIENFGNGWYRCWQSTTDTPATHTISIASAPGDGYTNFAGDGYSVSNYFFGVQVSDGYGPPPDYHLDSINGHPAFLYPPPSTTEVFFSTDGYIVVDSVSSFPETDGYLKIGEEIVFYSDAIDGYDGYNAFYVTARDPFGCNDGYHYNPGTKVQLFRGFEEINGTSFIPTEICLPEPPAWVEESIPGLESAGDLGIGQVVELHWGLATAPPGEQLLFNVYWGTNLQSLWDAPRGITSEQAVLVPDLSPGDGYYFAVRATYFPNSLDITQLRQLSGQLYAYPNSTYLTSNYSAVGTSALIVNSTAGFPSAGFILVDFEIFEYSSITSNSFVINRRDVFDFGNIEAHTAGTHVVLYHGIEDDNSQYYHNVATWDKGEVGPLMPIPQGGPSYMQGADGYREQPVDSLTEDHSNFENNNEGFEAYPFCGYRATNFVSLYTRGVCNTYFGGHQDGLGGIDINTINLQRQELLLGITGEPFTLLRRKFTGKSCPKLSLRHEHSHARCGICYNTPFEGGYDRFINPRQLRPALDNPNGLIMARVVPYKNDLDRSPERGYTQIDEVSAWTLPIPQLKDSDILVKYIYDPKTLEIIEEEFRYQVLNVTRNRIIAGNDGQQSFALRKLDKDDIIYTFPVPIV